jgi:SRSO17 transposase
MAFAEGYRKFFKVARRNVGDHARGYLNGLLSKAPRKNMERMVESLPDLDYQSQQQFLSDSPWDHRAVMDQVARDTDAIFGGVGSVLVIDESGLSKKGDKSAGVARQYNGRLGKVDNCQVGVFAALCDSGGGGLVDARLYLPQEWVEDRQRCLKAKVPLEEIVKKTKPQIALEMIQRAAGIGLRFGWVAFDAGYGSA